MDNNDIDIGDILKKIISMTRVLKDFSRGASSPEKDLQIVEDFFNNNDNNYNPNFNNYNGYNNNINPNYIHNQNQPKKKSNLWLIVRYLYSWFL